MPALAIYNFGNAVYSAVGEYEEASVLSWFFRSAEYYSEPVFCDRLSYGCGRSGIGQYHFPVCICSINPAGTASCKDIYALHPGKLRLDPELTKDILKLGMPSGLQNVIFQFANSFVQMGVNSFDATMVAGNSAATNADAMVYDVMAAFYTACGSFMGQNYGAGKKKRGRNSYLISTGIFLRHRSDPGSVTGIFRKSVLSCLPDAAVMNAGMYRLTIMGFFVLYFGIYGLYHCGGQSHGQKHYTYVHCHHGLLRVPCNLGLHHICLFSYDTVPVSAVCFLWSITAVAEISISYGSTNRKWLSCRKTEEPFLRGVPGGACRSLYYAASVSAETETAA